MVRLWQLVFAPFITVPSFLFLFVRIHRCFSHIRMARNRYYFMILFHFISIPSEFVSIHMWTAKPKDFQIALTLQKNEEVCLFHVLDCINVGNVCLLPLQSLSLLLYVYYVFLHLLLHLFMCPTFDNKCVVLVPTEPNGNSLCLATFHLRCWWLPNQKEKPERCWIEAEINSNKIVSLQVYSAAKHTQAAAHSVIVWQRTTHTQTHHSLTHSICLDPSCTYFYILRFVYISSSHTRME